MRPAGPKTAMSVNCVHIMNILGRRQVVRHLVLVQAFGGSNPSVPATKAVEPMLGFFRPFYLPSSAIRKWYSLFMFTFSGRLSRGEYARAVVLSLVGLVVVSGSLLWLLDIQDAEVPGASSLNQALAIVFFILYVLSLGYFGMHILSAIVRRARDTGRTTLWTVLGVLMPLGLLMLWVVSPRE